MAKKKTGLWIGLSILILGVLGVVYYLYLSPKAKLRRLEAKKQDGTITDEEEEELDILIQSQYVPESFPLKEWMRGPNVKKLQNKLNTSPKCKEKLAGKLCKSGKRDIPVLPLDEDGMFGNCTKKALIGCQHIFALNEVDYVQMMNPYVAPHTSKSLSWA